MKKWFSPTTIGLVLFNGLLLLGIAYIWYPSFREKAHPPLGGHTGEMYVPGVPTRPADMQTDSIARTTSTSVPEEEAHHEEQVASGDAGGEEKTLPEAVNLPVPFTSQAPEANWDQPWQDACEEAALLMLDAYYKEYGLSMFFAKDELLKMIEWGHDRAWGNSIPLIDIKTLAEWYMGDQYRFTIIENPTIRDLKSYLAGGYPVYVVADGKTLDNPNFTNGGPEYHALILRGYTPDGFISNDPGTRNGKEFFYTYDNLMESIHDWNSGDVPQGRRVVIVAEPI